MIPASLPSFVYEPVVAAARWAIALMGDSLCYSRRMALKSTCRWSAVSGQWFLDE
ncbi:MAG: hypothetical protein GDA38_02630 [Hormoscilla sp. SP12CHS1]|nr:hypothetical protein [Hormoscilla sp. SP12CHS1]